MGEFRAWAGFHLHLLSGWTLQPKALTIQGAGSRKRPHPAARCVSGPARGVPTALRTSGPFPPLTAQGPGSLWKVGSKWQLGPRSAVVTSAVTSSASRAWAEGLMGAARTRQRWLLGQGPNRQPPVCWLVWPHAGRGKRCLDPAWLWWPSWTHRCLALHRCTWLSILLIHQ